MTAEIAVGIVHHRAHAPTSLQAGAGVSVVSHVNAGPEGQPWWGFGRNHNRLMDEAQADWYVALNPDVEVTTEDIRELVETATAADLTLAAPLLESPWGSAGLPQARFPSARLWSRELFLGASGGSSAREGVVESAWVSGACIAIDLHSGARFSDDYFLYFEDTDLCRRTWAQGCRVGVCTNVSVGHASGWRLDDPLLRERGVQFARSAETFAASCGGSRGAMRLAGYVKALSRTVLPRRSESQRAAAAAQRHGFRRPHSARGLEELADEYNRGFGRV